MNANDLLTLGLGLTEPWKVVGQALDLEKRNRPDDCFLRSPAFV